VRTFENSEVRDYSWPCVLVLVDHWVGADEFGTGRAELPPEEWCPGLCTARRANDTGVRGPGRPDRPRPAVAADLDLAEDRCRRRFPADQQHPGPGQHRQRRHPGLRGPHRLRAHQSACRRTGREFGSLRLNRIGNRGDFGSLGARDVTDHRNGVATARAWRGLTPRRNTFHWRENILIGGLTRSKRCFSIWPNQSSN
jgi:hypothetical protein